MSLADDLLNAITGTTVTYNGIRLPKGFFWEDGKAYSRTTYQRLFGVLTETVIGDIVNTGATISNVGTDLTQLDNSPIGWPISGPGIQAGTTILSFTSNSITMSLNATATTNGASIVIAPHGVGDGSTTFNVPDSRGRVDAGRDNMGGTAASRLTTASGVNGVRVGVAGGTETHTLTAAQMPQHAHGVSDPGHYHNVNANNYAIASSGGSGTKTPYGGPGNYVDGATVLSNGTGISIQNAGSGGAHPNVQPTLVRNKIIKY